MLKRIIKYPRSAITISIISVSVFLLTQCIDKESGPVVIRNADGEQFAGSEKCAGCHKNIYEDHIRTAHYLTSRKADEKYIKGSFENGKNKFSFNKSVAVVMEKRKDGFYQVEYFKDDEKKAKRFDIVVGSGTMGQSYLYWLDHHLFQMPITYFSAANEWSNSPGFPDKVVFNRVITSRCLECHTTFAKTISEPDTELERFDNNRIIFGVDCEKCHGPAAKHVAFQTENPQEKKGEYIINPGKLSRQQNLDLCASCHGGRLQKTKPSFTFEAGDALSDYFIVDTTAPKPANIDVHGNQYGLLRASKCFILTNTLTCNTCHNTHKTEKGNVALFSQRCMSCHNTEHGKVCKMQKTLGDVITTNCIDCHMPLQPSRAIAVKLQENEAPTAALIRSHFISIYPQETQKLIDKMKKTNSNK